MNIRIALVFTVCVWRGAEAQQSEPSLQRESQAKPEEIVIVGEHALRLQVMAAEKHAYDIFNQFNDEKRFNISCSISAPTGSRFETQYCQPEFEVEAIQAHAQDYYESLRNFLNPNGGVPDASVVPTHASMEVEIGRQQPAFKLKMKQVAEQHPEFVEAIKQYSELRKKYEGVVESEKK
ncbi:MAG TPA: hypothetical protein VMH83_07515 [Candidatus Acidoferrum sp.]|nr:hypothetical protein [Candidatus Acidoferrum sp.]